MRVVIDIEIKKSKKNVANERDANVNNLSSIAIKKINHVDRHREAFVLINMTNLIVNEIVLANVLMLSIESREISNIEIRDRRMMRTRLNVERKNRNIENEIEDLEKDDENCHECSVDQINDVFEHQKSTQSFKRFDSDETQKDLRESKK